MNTFSRQTSNSLRGLMQLDVVFSHLSYVVPGVLLFTLANKLGTSVIALFFFMSGFGLMRGIDWNKSGSRTGLFRLMVGRIWHVACPMLLLSLIFILLLWWDTGHLPQDLMYNLFRYGETPLPNSWFIFVLIYLYCAFTLSFASPRINPLWGLILLSILSLIGVLVPYLLGYERAWWATTLAFPAGAIYAYGEERIYLLMRRWWGFGLGLAVIGLISLSNIELLLPLAFVIIPILFIVLLNWIGYDRWIHSLGDSPKGKILSFLSSISFELYLIHGMLIRLFRGGVMYSFLMTCCFVSVCCWGLYWELGDSINFLSGGLEEVN